MRAVAAIYFLAAFASATHLVTPSAVTIPQLTTHGALGLGKPILHKHGLIQVEVPVRHHAIKPAEITAAAPYAVGAPTKGIVVDQTEPTYFCKKEGFVLEGRDTCVMTDLVEARFVCPGGFDFFDGECTRRATFLQICPEGFETREGTCAKVVTTQSISVCPDDSFEVSPGVCERETIQALAHHCHEGRYDGANCIVDNHIEARAFCPEGFSFFDGACVQEETYDCTNGLQAAGHNTVSTPLLTQGRLQQGHLGLTHGGLKHGHLRQLTAIAHGGLLGPALGLSTNTLVAPTTLGVSTSGLLKHSHGGAGISPCKAKKAGLGGVYAAAEVNTECAQSAALAQSATVAQSSAIAHSAAIEEVKTLVQPTKTTVTIQKTCTRVTSTALVFACDEGILQGQRCLVRTPMAPTHVCKHRGDANHCYTTQRVSALSVCPPNYTRECSNGRCECAALEAAAFVQSCPMGFLEGGDQGCYRTASASIVCPTGYTLQGESCVRILREPADCVFSVTYECDRTQGQCL